MQVTSILKVKEPWISDILAGKKIWEMRGNHTRTRGPVVLGNDGLLRGIVEIQNSLKLDQEAVVQNADKHRCQPAMLQSLGYDHAWVLANAFKFDQPVAYDHHTGCISWIRLENQTKTVRDKLRLALPSSVSLAAVSQLRLICCHFLVKPSRPRATLLAT